MIELISLFSGAGGLDLGFEQQGFVSVIAYDQKLCAIDTYNFNREHGIAYQKDLFELSGIDIVNDLQLLASDAQPKGVIGGPPCQYYSTGNTTPPKDDDIRRILTVKYAEILKELNEVYSLDFFLFENVRGLANSNHREDFQALLAKFEDAGFYIDWAILDAADFGVPQRRKRVFVIGWNNQKYPELMFKFPVGNKKRKTVREAIENLDEPTYYAKGLNSENFSEHPNHWTMQPKSEKFKNPKSLENRKNPRSFRKLEWDELSATVAYGNNEIHVHPNGHRRLSIYEAMLLQSFPHKDYQLVGNLSQQVSLVSDAVPPMLAKTIAGSIKNFIQQHEYNEDRK